jgi:hypothetical protein
LVFPWFFIELVSPLTSPAFPAIRTPTSKEEKETNEKKRWQKTYRKDQKKKSGKV